MKICGITRVEDALLAAEAGADYIGLILYPKSPRFVSPRARREILRELRGVLRVAVLVNPSPEEAESVLEEGFDLIQLHGEEEYEIAQRVGPEKVIKAFRVKDELPFIEGSWRKVHALLLDTYSPLSRGGTGRSFDWRIARRTVEEGFRVILSGGLTPENVAKAIRMVKPYGVDVSSGVEARKGVKDPDRVRRFIRAVRECSI